MKSATTIRTNDIFYLIWFTTVVLYWRNVSKFEDMSWHFACHVQYIWSRYRFTTTSITTKPYPDTVHITKRTSTAWKSAKCYTLTCASGSHWCLLSDNQASLLGCPWKCVIHSISQLKTISISILCHLLLCILNNFGHEDTDSESLSTENEFQYFLFSSLC